MRNQRRGRIVNITSVGGRMAIPFHSTYHVSKFALEGLSESIQYELEPFGFYAEFSAKVVYFGGHFKHKLL
jgi:short-subunit dehydrogenase